MGRFLGIDTSNYTTSLAVWDTDTGVLTQQKQLLPVKEGTLGLRQSDALFHHTRQIPELMEQLDIGKVDAVGVSDKPTECEGSYMPCFLAGVSVARSLAAALSVPLYRFTHQQGHVAAALYGSGQTAWMSAPFLAFHVSGGTTDGLLVTPSADTVLSCEKVAGSLDLKAGQLIDRVGGMLGLGFPAGPALERLAAQSTRTFTPKASLDGLCCHLSGVENQCRRFFEEGGSAADTAKLCLDSVLAVLAAMTQRMQAQYGNLPLLYAGGVMSNGYLQQQLGARFGGSFAPSAYSVDNAAGIAVLTAIKANG